MYKNKSVTHYLKWKMLDNWISSVKSRFYKKNYELQFLVSNVTWQEMNMLLG